MAFAALSEVYIKSEKAYQRKQLKRRSCKALFEEAINATPRKVRLISQWSNIKQKCTGGRPLIMTPDIIDKLDSFLCRNDISFTSPGRNNQVYLERMNKVGAYLSLKSTYYGHLTNLLVFYRMKRETFCEFKVLNSYRYTRSRKSISFKVKYQLFHAYALS